MPTKKPAEPLTHQQLLDASGKTVRDLVEATGLTDAGVRKCLRENRLPVNALVRKAYAAVLGLAEEGVPA